MPQRARFGNALHVSCALYVPWRYFLTRLTTDVLKNAKPENGKQLELRDDIERGLIFRVTSGGKKSWSLRYRTPDKKMRRKVLGLFPAMSLAKAREEAKVIKGQIATKIDVVGEEIESQRQKYAESLNTLDALSKVYFEAAAVGMHRAGKGVDAKRQSTLDLEKSTYRRFIADKFGRRPVTDIRRIDIQQQVNVIGKSSPSTARLFHVLMRQLLNFAVFNDLIEFNPATQIAIPKTNPRERLLSNMELKTIWDACLDPASVPGLAISREMTLALRFTLVTLQRGGSVVGMKWDEISSDNNTWLIPALRMKGKRAHTVPLSQLAMSILEEARSLIGSKEFVFASPRTGIAMERRALSRAMKRLTNALDIKNATVHDFRRAGATNLTGQKVGIPRFIVSQVLAHSTDTGGAATATGIYDINDYLAEKRKALDAWANRLTEIVEGQEMPDNVITINALNR